MTQVPQNDEEERVVVKLTLRRSTFDVFAGVARAGDTPMATYLKQELERLAARIVGEQVTT
jgi:hypothetical protein